MKSSKKLLVSALASSIFCSSVSGVIEAKGRYRSKSVGSNVVRSIESDVVEANGRGRLNSSVPRMSRGLKIALGVGIPGFFVLGGGTAVGIACCKKTNSSTTSEGGDELSEDDELASGIKNDNDDEFPVDTKVEEKLPILKNLKKEKWEKEVSSAKIKIVEIIGEEKYGVLEKACRKFSSDSWDEKKSFKTSAQKVKNGVTFIKLANGGTLTELAGSANIYEFLNNVNLVNNFSRNNIYNVIYGCLRVVAMGLDGFGEICNMNNSLNDEWGAGFRYVTDGEKIYYDTFVSSNLEKIKLCYHNSYDNKDCDIILKV